MCSVFCPQTPMMHTCVQTHTHGSVCVAFAFVIGWKSSVLQDGCVFVHSHEKKYL